MLVLARKVNESIVIDGRIVVTVMRLEGDVVKVGITAPNDVPVHRREVYDEIQHNNRRAATRREARVPKLQAAASPSCASPLPSARSSAPLICCE